MWTKEQQRASSQKHYYKDLDRSRRRARENAKKHVVKSYYRRLERVYGLTDSGYQMLLESQNYRCAICRSFNVKGKANQFHVDHSHKTNKIRGLLCNNCNALIGYAKDDPKILISSILYLLKPTPLDYLDSIIKGL